MKHNLYTYVPKKNTLKTDGLYGPSGDSEENLARRYGWRAGSTDKMDILNWLESTAPGRSHAVSVLTEPIPEDIDGRLGEFRDSSAMVTLPSYRELLAAGAVVPPLYRSNTDGAGMLPRKRMSYRPIQWEKARKSFDGLAFKNIPHYLLVTKDGRIPPHLLLAVAIAGTSGK